MRRDPALVEEQHLVGERDRRLAVRDHQHGRRRFGRPGPRTAARPGSAPPPAGRPRWSRRPGPAAGVVVPAPGPARSVAAGRRTASYRARRPWCPARPAAPSRSRRPERSAVRPRPPRRCSSAAERDVAADRVVEQERGLRHQRDRTPASSSRASSRRSTPSSLTAPSSGSTSRVSSVVSVDLPAPVGPTIATVRPGSTVKSTPASTSRSGRYPNRTSGHLRAGPPSSRSAAPRRTPSRPRRSAPAGPGPSRPRERGSSPSTQPSARIGNPISVNRNATWTTSPASAAPELTRPTPTSSTAEHAEPGQTVDHRVEHAAGLVHRDVRVPQRVRRGPGTARSRRPRGPASSPPARRRTTRARPRRRPRAAAARGSRAAAGSAGRSRWPRTPAGTPGSRPARASRPPRTSRRWRTPSIAITPMAIGSGAIRNQVDSTSAFAFDSSCPVGCLWCHSSGSFRYCRVTRRRYVACSRYCITPAPIRRPTTPIARRIGDAEEQRRPASDRAEGGVTALERRPDHVVGGPAERPAVGHRHRAVQHAASTDSAKTPRLLPDRDPQDREPAPGHARPCRGLSASGTERISRTVRCVRPGTAHDND